MVLSFTQLVVELHGHRIELCLAGMESFNVFPGSYQFFCKRFTAFGIATFRYSLYSWFYFCFFSFYLANLTLYASVLRPNLLLPFAYLRAILNWELIKAIIEMVGCLRYIRALLGFFSQKIAECCSLLMPLIKELGWNGEMEGQAELFPLKMGDSVICLRFYH